MEFRGSVDIYSGSFGTHMMIYGVEQRRYGKRLRGRGPRFRDMDVHLLGPLTHVARSPRRSATRLRTGSFIFVPRSPFPSCAPSCGWPPPSVMNAARPNVVYHYTSIIETTIVGINHAPGERRLNALRTRFPTQSEDSLFSFSFPWSWWCHALVREVIFFIEIYRITDDSVQLYVLARSFYIFYSFFIYVIV